MALRHSYTLLAPIYDFIVGGRALHNARHHNLEQLAQNPGQLVLLSGIGTGLDLPLLPGSNEYVGLDITAAMLRRARGVKLPLKLSLQQGDAMNTPYRDNSFDTVIMHLILAVVPEPQRALQEAIRTVKPGGRIYILDKFLRPGKRAPLRRLLSPLIGQIATRTDVVFEEVLQACNDANGNAVDVIQDSPSLAGGWFRNIVLQKK